jgi:hypothetical protein
MPGLPFPGIFNASFMGWCFRVNNQACIQAPALLALRSVVLRWSVLWRIDNCFRTSTMDNMDQAPICFATWCHAICICDLLLRISGVNPGGHRRYPRSSVIVSEFWIGCSIRGYLILSSQSRNFLRIACCAT